MKGILISTMFPAAEVDFDTLESVREHVGGYVENHRVPRIEQNVLFDEDGLSKGLSINHTATALLRACGFGKAMSKGGVVGPVLIVGPADLGGWTEVPANVRRQILAFCRGENPKAVAYGLVGSHTSHADPTKGESVVVTLGLHQAMEGDLELSFHASLRGKFHALFGRYVKVTVESLDPLMLQNEHIETAFAEARAQGVS